MRKILLAIITALAAAMFAPALANATTSAVQGHSWVNLGGASLFPKTASNPRGGIHSKAEFAADLASPTGRQAMTAQGISLADQAILIKAAQDPKNISGCLLKYGQPVPSMSFGSPVRAEFNVTFADPYYAGKRGAWAYCVHADFKSAQKIECGPWMNKTVVNADGSKDITPTQPCDRIAANSFIKLGAPDKCGNFYPLGAGGVSSKTPFTRRKKTQHIPAPPVVTPTQPTPAPVVPTFVKQLQNASGVDITSSQAGMSEPLTAYVIHNGVKGSPMQLQVNLGTPFTVSGAAIGDSVLVCGDPQFMGIHDEGLLDPVTGDIITGCITVPVTGQGPIAIVDKEWPPVFTATGSTSVTGYKTLTQPCPNDTTIVKTGVGTTQPLVSPTLTGHGATQDAANADLLTQENTWKSQNQPTVDAQALAAARTNLEQQLQTCPCPPPTPPCPPPAKPPCPPTPPSCGGDGHDGNHNGDGHDGGSQDGSGWGNGGNHSGGGSQDGNG